MKLTPICSGMPRSASRMTWQIVAKLTPMKSRPPKWVSNNEKVNVDCGVMWPFRTHKYIDDLHIPAIYTFRHPIEAWLSFRSRFEQDKELALAEADAFMQIGASWEVGQRYERDIAKGRDVLFLRYEDFYDDRRKRIRVIAEFMGLDIDEERVEEIFEDTSLEKNIDRGRAIFKAFPELKFGDGASTMPELGGMQRLHVNEKTMGVPGVWLEGYPEFVKLIRNPGPGTAFEALRDMCFSLGYEV